MVESSGESWVAVGVAGGLQSEMLDGTLPTSGVGDNVPPFTCTLFQVSLINIMKLGRGEN